MKKLLAALIAVSVGMLSLANPALSLPGKTKKEIYDWVKNNQFLSTWLQDLKSPGNYHMVAFRELQDHWFFDIYLYPGENEIDYVQLSLLKKRPIPKPPHEFEDQRKWENIDCKDVWIRDNKTALSLISQSFGEKIANDFKNSKLVFSGPNFYHPILFDDFQAKIDLDQNGNKIPVNEMKIRNYDDQIFIGKLFSYEKSYRGSFETTLCYGLNIYPIKWGEKTANAYQHNFNIFNLLKKQKDLREKPASIKVE